jgi:pyruvate formate lyase activating enzyme
MKPAMFYEKIENNGVRCLLCPHGCVLRQGRTGICMARKNMDGQLYSLNYARVSSIALDPIEKKPLYHFHPGKTILSAGTFGCNFKCGYCQNWSISQRNARTMELMPEKLADLAVEYTDRGNIGVAFTYNEPSIWYEYVYETAMLVKERGMSNVLVTNGYINEEPLEKLLPYIDAMNIDVKAFTDGFYEKYCKGSLNAVKKTVETAVKRCHVEITTLVIPGLNDDPGEIEKMAEWLSGMSRDIVLHLTRFFPNYMMNDIPPTPRDVLENSVKIAKKQLKHVYAGNI